MAVGLVPCSIPAPARVLSTERGSVNAFEQMEHDPLLCAHDCNQRTHGPSESAVVAALQQRRLKQREVKVLVLNPGS